MYLSLEPFIYGWNESFFACTWYSFCKLKTSLFLWEYPFNTFINFCVCCGGEQLTRRWFRGFFFFFFWCAFWMGPGLNIFLRTRKLFRHWNAVILLMMVNCKRSYLHCSYHTVAMICNKSHMYISHKSYQFCITRKLWHGRENSPNTYNSHGRKLCLSLLTGLSHLS